MPELPEVEAARRALEEHCVGKKIKKSIVAADDKVIEGVAPKDFEAALVGKTIVAARRKGKNMWLELDSPPFPSFQFGMTGAVYIKGVAVTKYKRSAVKDEDEWPSKYSKLFVELADGLEFSFTDKRRFARVRLLDNPVSVPPISELGPDALMEPMTVDEFYNSLSKKNIGIKALLLDQSFISGIGNWMADEVLYQARIHPQQTASRMSKESCATLLKCINEVIEKALEVGADSSQFPNSWIFHSREKKPGKAFVDGMKIEFIKAGNRATAYVPELQKLIGNKAVKETDKTSKGNTTGKGESVEESENEDEPRKPNVMKGRKASNAGKPSKKKSSASVEDSNDDEDDNSADDASSKRKGRAKNPPARSKSKRGKNDEGAERRKTRGKSAPAKRKQEGSDDDLTNSSGSGDEDEDEEAQAVLHGKKAKAAAASKRRAASNQNTKRKKKAN